MQYFLPAKLWWLAHGFSCGQTYSYIACGYGTWWSSVSFHPPASELTKEQLAPHNRWFEENQCVNQVSWYHLPYIKINLLTKHYLLRAFWLNIFKKATNPKRTVPNAWFITHVKCWTATDFWHQGELRYLWDMLGYVGMIKWCLSFWLKTAANACCAANSVRLSPLWRRDAETRRLEAPRRMQA